MSKDVVGMIGGIREIFGQSGNFIKVLHDLSEAGREVQWALCGAMAMGFYGHIRSTEDVDILVESEAELEKLKWNSRVKFKSGRGHAIVHKETGIEVEILTPEFMKGQIDPVLIAQCLREKGVKNVGGVEIPVVNLVSLLGLKTGRAVRPRGVNLRDDAKSNSDLADIQNLILKNRKIDLSKLEGVDDERRKLLTDTVEQLKSIKGFCKSRRV